MRSANAVNLAALVIALGAAPATRGQAGQQAVGFGGFRAQIDGIVEPGGVAVMADGTIVVTETPRDRLLLFAPDGEPRGTWAPQPPDGGPGLCRPTGVAVAPGGEVIVCDTGHHRLVTLEPDGTWRGAIGGYGREAGRFRGPLAVAAAEDRIYVADTDNARVQVLDAEGIVLDLIGGWGHEDGQFVEITGIAVDQDGSIFTVDAGRNRVQHLGPHGQVLDAWGGWGTFPGLFSEPSGVALHEGRVVVSDRLGHRLQVFTPDGEFLDQWGQHAQFPREGRGRIHYPSAVAAAPDGSFVVIAESFENRLQVFGPREDAGDRGPPPVMPPRGVQSHFGGLITADGQLLAVTEPEVAAIVLFDLRGEIPIHVTTCGEPGSGWGLLSEVGALDLDEPSRRLTVADNGNGRIQQFAIDFDPEETLRFDPLKMRFAKGWPLLDADDEDGGGPPPAVLAIHHDDGRTYMLDRRSASVLVYEGGIRPVARFGGPGEGPGTLTQPVDLAIAGDTVYVVDTGRRCIAMFGTDGAPRGSFGRAGAAAGEFIDPRGITVDSSGAVYVTDSALDRVQKFDRDGAFLLEWGSTGIEHGRFFKPLGIAADERESLRLIVVDYGNHRMQGFSPDGEWLLTFGVGRAWTRENVPR